VNLCGRSDGRCLLSLLKANGLELLGGWDGCGIQRCTGHWDGEFLLWRMGHVSHAEWWHLEHTMEHKLSDAGPSIESVPEFQYWKWRLHPIVGCHRSRWAWWQLYRWVIWPVTKKALLLLLLSSSMALQPFCWALAAFFQFLNPIRSR
jgi:hypothetical protein